MITRAQFSSQWKAHLLFGGAFLAALAFSVGMKMIAGEPFSEASWTAVRGIRPIELVMAVAFWYYCAFYYPKDEWTSSFTSLNLRSKDEEHT